MSNATSLLIPEERRKRETRVLADLNGRLVLLRARLVDSLAALDHESAAQVLRTAEALSAEADSIALIVEEYLRGMATLVNGGGDL